MSRWDSGKGVPGSYMLAKAFTNGWQSKEQDEADYKAYQEQVKKIQEENKTPK